MNNSQTAFKVRDQLSEFLGIFSPHFSKPVTGFIGDMLYGLQASQDIKLSCIGRGIDESIPLKKTEERLSRHLVSEGLGEQIGECIAKEGSKRIKKDTLIVIDPTDIRKEYARKMPYLGRVRDGSRGELCNGYWGCAAVACESGARRIMPLHLRLWSCQAPGFKSENDEIAQIVDMIRAYARRRGIYVIDRGGDRDEFYKFFMGNELDFIIRMVGNRHLLWRTRPVLADKLAGKCKMPYAETIRRETSEGKKVYTIEYGSMDVRHPDHPDVPLRMVVIKGFGQKPMMLLTTLADTASRQSLWQVVEGYLSRWRVEDAIRYITHVSKRLFGVVEFHYYAIADGLAYLFTRFGKWKGGRKACRRDGPSKQIILPCFEFS